jgi:hypothetical protein
VKCRNCNKEIRRYPSEIKKSKSGNSFCSRSCTATFNNKNYPKRQLTKTCNICKNFIRSDLKYCRVCYQEKNYIINKTLEETTQRRKNDNNRYNQIRQISRKNYMRSDRPKCCAVCGYDKHIEICHIKDIASFSKTTLVSEINDLSNLIALCRNHHWELDHGYLTIEEIEEIKTLENRPTRI